MRKIILSMFLLGTLLSANSQVPSYLPGNGLVGWWPFNGNANDESGNGNNGTVSGATLTSDRFGNSNKAYSFDGLNDFIQSDTISSLNLSVNSISTWIYAPSFSVHHQIEYSAPTFGTLGRAFAFNISRLAIVPHSNCVDASGPGVINLSGQLGINSWYNLVFVSDGSIGKFYINGVFISQTNIGSSICQNPLALTLGRGTNGGGPMWYTGKIDDIGIWNRALTQQEIIDLYNNCSLTFINEPTNQTSNISGQAQFNSLANDTTVSYQWQSNHANMGWANIPSNSFYSGVTSKKLTVNNIKLKNHQQLFRVIATKNTCKDTSAVAMLTVNDTCITSTTDTLYIKVNTSSLSNPVYNTIKVYPNPSSTQVIIDNGNYSTMGSYTAKIVNASGQQVFQSVINQQKFVIDANTMGGAGLYTLYIIDANNKVVGVKKIVLQ